MLNPNPLSPFLSSIITGSLLHMASPVRGSIDLDFLFSKFDWAGGSVGKAWSDFDLTSLSGTFSMTPVLRGDVENSPSSA